MAAAVLQDLHSLADLERVKREAGDRVILIDFHAEWCGPCKAIAPVYARLAQQWRQVVFTRCDVDKASDVAQRFGIRAMPTFVFLRNGSKADELRGADPNGLQSKLQTVAGPANPNYAAASGAGGSNGTPAPSGSGSSLLGQINKPQSTCLNETSAHPLAGIFTAGSTAYLESDADEQLLLSLQMQQTLRLRALTLKTAEAAALQAPKTLKLFINRPTISFDDADSEKAVQEIELTAEQAAGKSPVQLRYVAFQRVQSLQIFVKENFGGEDSTRIDSLDLFGEMGEATGDLKSLQQAE